MTTTPKPNQIKPRANLLRALLSVLAALFGVQSNKNAIEDFKQPSLVVYIILGIIVVALLVLMLSAIVSKIVV